MVVTWFPLHMHSSLKDRTGEGDRKGSTMEGRTKGEIKEVVVGGVGIKGNGRKREKSVAVVLVSSQGSH